MWMVIMQHITESFGVENNTKEIRKLIDNKNIIKNIYKIQENDSTMCRYFCVRFIGFMLKVKVC